MNGLFLRHLCPEPDYFEESTVLEMTFVSSGVSLLSQLRYSDGFYHAFTAIIGLVLLYLIRRMFFKKHNEDTNSNEDVTYSDNENVNDENDNDIDQEDMPKKVVELKDIDGNGTSEMLFDMESDYETTVDILQTLGKLHGKLATAELRAKTKILEQAMTQEQRKEESDIKQQQLESIYSLMKAQGDKFGLQDKGDLEEQMKLYAI
uniref:Matrix-remodeling-associated protein 7 n=1 Tax=Steinernema glaseri TaxID=37863 RepID=A0A1I8AL24_9BILA